MRNKLILILTLLLLAVMFLSYLFVRSSLKLDLSKENEELLEQVRLPQDEMPPSNLTGKRAITIINSPQRRGKVLPAFHKPSKSNENYPAAAPSLEVEPKAPDEPGSATAGITRINKQPTEQQREEMSAKKVLIF